MNKKLNVRINIEGCIGTYQKEILSMWFNEFRDSELWKKRKSEHEDWYFRSSIVEVNYFRDIFERFKDAEIYNFKDIIYNDWNDMEITFFE